MPIKDDGVGIALKEQFAKLPKVVQDAILSANVEKQLRSLADKHKLHLDQWGALENEVQLTLLGIQPTENLAKNIKAEIGATDEVAEALAADISEAVFEPIRQQLERELGNENAVAEKTTDMEALRTQTLGKSPGQSVPTSTATPVPSSAVAPVIPQSEPIIPKSAPVIAATPPAPPPQGTAVRAAISEVYKAGESSAARKAVHDDPYREPPQ